VPEDFGPIRFAGRYWLEESGLYHNSLRFYEPTLRRFLQQDPIRYEGGDYNLYRYVGNNPLSFTDPTGMSALSEYGQLVKRVSSCVKKLKGFGDCVDTLLGGAARAVEAAVNGGGGGSPAIDVNCALKNTGKTCVK
jgi:RHS repeat-associated protein